MEIGGLQSNRNWNQDWRRVSINISVIAAIISLLLHVVSVFSLAVFDRPVNPVVKAPIKVRLVDKSATKAADRPQSDVDRQKMIETPLPPTARPKHADYAGATDHQAEKETKVARVLLQERAKDAGQKGKVDATGKVERKEQAMKKVQSRSAAVATEGKVVVKPVEKSPEKARTAYEALLPLTASEVAGQVNAGYQEYIDDNVEIGDRIDLNTTEYRYIGYFSSLRKSIELVWNYPMEAARRGMQGEVDVEFAINKDGRAGRIRVVKSSGYPILDDAIVEAIRLASPFAPLPKGFNKERLVIVGAFHYVLSAH